MGAGGKFESNKVFVRDIGNTKYCPLAKNIRKRLKAVGIDKGIKAVYSTEIASKASLKLTDGTNFKKSFYGTNSWMPALFGLYAAETAIKYLLKK
jgi:tRNA A37 threonylcarbamoyladenosine dehydratase